MWGNSWCLLFLPLDLRPQPSCAAGGRRLVTWNPRCMWACTLQVFRGQALENWSIWDPSPVAVRVRGATRSRGGSPWRCFCLGQAQREAGAVKNASLEGCPLSEVGAPVRHWPGAPLSSSCRHWGVTAGWCAWRAWWDQHRRERQMFLPVSQFLLHFDPVNPECLSGCRDARWAWNIRWLAEKLAK